MPVALWLLATLFVEPVSARVPNPRELRYLMGIARSAIADAYFEVQSSLHGSRAIWWDWVTDSGEEGVRKVVPATTRAALPPCRPPATVTDVDVILRKPVSAEGVQGALDLRVTATTGEARLTLVERHSIRFVNGTSPIPAVPVFLEVAPTPMLSWLEEGEPVPPWPAGSAPELVARLQIDLMRVAQRADPTSNGPFQKTSECLQFIRGRPEADGRVDGDRVIYTKSVGAGRSLSYRRELGEAPAVTSPPFAELSVQELSSSGGPYARITAAEPGKPPCTVLLRVMGAELATSSFLDWSLLDPLKKISWRQFGAGSPSPSPRNAPRR
jgi:hypothetical protein